jgi:hypothetical protein
MNVNTGPGRKDKATLQIMARQQNKGQFEHKNEPVVISFLFPSLDRPSGNSANL